MYANGWIDEEAFENTFAQRLKNCQQIATNNDKRLLIREHTHSLFFQPERINQRAGFSWVGQRSLELFGSECPVICTIRDPVDSWLGIKHSFRSEADYSFDEYCARYRTFFERVKELDESRLVVFRYEDFLLHSEEFFELVAEKFYLPQMSASESTVLYSGNSGRQSDQLSRRPRRAYSTSFIRAVEDSENYTALISLLGYEDCREDINGSDRFYAKVNSLRKLVLDRILAFGRYGNRVLKNASVSD